MYWFAWPTPSVLRVFHSPNGFILPEPCSSVSCCFRSRIRVFRALLYLGGRTPLGATPLLLFSYFLQMVTERSSYVSSTVHSGKTGDKIQPGDQSSNPKPKRTSSISSEWPKPKGKDYEGFTGSEPLTYKALTKSSWSFRVEHVA